MRIPGRFLRVILLLASIALPGFFAARHLASWPARVRYPGALDNVESTVLAEMVRRQEGVPIYAPASTGRFDGVIYGPLFYLMGSPLMDPQGPAYLHLREISFLATLGLAAGCALLAFWLARSYLAAAIASLLFLAYSFVTAFGTQARCDAVALLLWFSGFLVAYRLQSSRKILFAVPLMTLAFYYKQQYLAAPLAVLLFLLLEKRFRLAAEFATLLAIAGLSLLAVFQFLIFRNQAFLLHFLTYNVIRFSWHQGVQWTVVMGITFVVSLAVAAQFLWTQSSRLLACYLGGVVLLLPLMMGKMGANLNYSIELLLILCPIFAVQLIHGLSRPSRAPLWLCLLAATLILGNLFPVWVPQAKDFAQDQAVQSLLGANFPPRASTLGSYTDDLVRAGLDTPISDLSQYTWLVCQGTLSDQILLAPLRERRFALVLLRFDLQAEKDSPEPGGFCLPKQFYPVLTRSYQPITGPAARIFKTKNLFAWVPRDQTGLVPPENLR